MNRVGEAQVFFSLFIFTFFLFFGRGPQKHDHVAFSMSFLILDMIKNYIVFNCVSWTHSISGLSHYLCGTEVSPYLSNLSI